MENQLQNALKRNKLFDRIDLSSIELSNIKGRLLTISEGEILYKEGDSCEGIYLTVSGEINLLRKKSAGKTESVVIGKDEYFGHDELFKNASRKSIAVALMDSYLIALSKNEVDGLINQNSAIKENFSNLFSDFDEKHIQTEQLDIITEYTGEPEHKEDKIESEIEYIEESSSEILNDEEQNNTQEIKEDEIFSEAEREFESDQDEVNEQLVTDSELNSIIQSEEKQNVHFEEIEEETFDDLEVLENSFSEENNSDNENINEKENADIFEPESVNKNNDDIQIESPIENAGENLQTEDVDSAQDIEKDFDEEFLRKDDMEFIEFDKGEDKLETIGEGEDSFPEDKDKLFWEFENSKPIIDDEDNLEASQEENNGDVLKDEEPAGAQEERSEIHIEETEEENEVEGNEEDAAFITTRQLEMIINATRLVNSNLNLDDVLKNIVDAAVSITRSDRGTLYLIDKETDILWSKVLLGEELKRIELDMGEGIAGWVAENGEIVKLPDAYSDERFANKIDKESGYETKSMLCFPVKNKNEEIVGVLQLLNSKNGEFGKTDELFLSALSNHAALALENAELVEKLLNSERVSSLGKISNFLINDIKKPVLVSKRYTEHLKEKNIPEDIRKILDMILEQINQVAENINATANYSEGKTILRLVKKNIAPVLEVYCKKIEPFVKSKNCELVADIKADTKVNLDEKEFYQCFYHIVRNACEAMPEGGKINISTVLTDRGIDIKFKDQGLGIPENIIDKIFVTFMTHGKKEGAGLGLSITKKIVEIHEGSITAKSELGEGAEFIISLPSV